MHVFALQAGEAVRKAAVAAVRSDLGEQQQQAQGALSHQRRDPQQHTASRETHCSSVGDFANRPADSLPTERTAALLSGIDHLAVTAAVLLLPAAPRASGISVKNPGRANCGARPRVGKENIINFYTRYT